MLALWILFLMLCLLVRKLLSLALITLMGRLWPCMATGNIWVPPLLRMGR